MSDTFKRMTQAGRPRGAHPAAIDWYAEKLGRHLGSMPGGVPVLLVEGGVYLRRGPGSYDLLAEFDTFCLGLADGGYKDFRPTLDFPAP